MLFSLKEDLPLGWGESCAISVDPVVLLPWLQHTVFVWPNVSIWQPRALRIVSALGWPWVGLCVISVPNNAQAKTSTVIGEPSILNMPVSLFSDEYMVI